MKVLVTGSKGFLGRNLITSLKQIKEVEIYEYHRSSTEKELENYCKNADFVYHLAGTNRPKNEAEFIIGNKNLTTTIIDCLKRNDNKCPIMFASSTQAELQNPYGESKKAAEDILFKYAEEYSTSTYIYRFPNLFGKWSQPNYNTVIATFCHNIARGLPIQVHNPDAQINLVYVDDVVNDLIKLIRQDVVEEKTFYEVRPVYEKTLQTIADLIYSFKNSRETKAIPNMADDFVKKLYSTYLSFLPEDDFKYPLKMNVDERGSFTEFIKTKDRGQVSVNVSKPGIKKGEHWHHTKNEKFLVVSGEGVIRFRKLGSEEIIEYFVSDQTFEVIDIPVGYTHNIENLGQTDMVTMMWVNEIFDPNNPDTYYLEV